MILFTVMDSPSSGSSLLGIRISLGAHGDLSTRRQSGASRYQYQILVQFSRTRCQFEHANPCRWYKNSRETEYSVGPHTLGAKRSHRSVLIGFEQIHDWNLFGLCVGMGRCHI